MKKLLPLAIACAALTVSASPAPTYSTYLGGSCDESGHRLSGDSAGNMYVTGQTDSTDLPTTPGDFQATKNEGYDAFLTKINSAGTGILFSTYLGGSGDDSGKDIRVDPSGSYVYVVGTTNSADFPVTANAFQTINKGGQDVFIAKFNATDGTLVWCTLLGGSGTDVATSVSVDPSGNTYVTGYTNSGDFPVAGALQPVKNAGYDAFVAKISADGTSLVYSTFLGGNGDDFGQGIRVVGPAKFQDAGSVYATLTRLISPSLPEHSKRAMAVVMMPSRLRSIRLARHSPIPHTLAAATRTLP
jgi:hypothetical protein